MNPSTRAMKTMSETIEHLRKNGYTEDFNVQCNQVFCKSKNSYVDLAELRIDKSYRFEGESNPSDSAVAYAISAKNSELKGILVNGYGVYSDPFFAEIVRKLEE